MLVSVIGLVPVTDRDVGLPAWSRPIFSEASEPSVTVARPAVVQVKLAKVAPVTASTVVIARPCGSNSVAVAPAGSTTANAEPMLLPATVRTVPSDRISDFVAGSYPGTSEIDQPPNPTGAAAGAASTLRPGCRSLE